MTRTATAVWKGGLKDGNGVVTTETKVLDEQPYTFRSRFEDGKETNPEELLAAAHAACFAMALSAQLAEAGITADELTATSKVTMLNLEINKVDLVLRAKVSGGDEAGFMAAAEAAKAGCPVSKLFRAEITLDAALV